MSENRETPGVKSGDVWLSAHYSTSRLRTDTWNRVRDCARRLATAESHGAEADRLNAAIEEGLDQLRPIEQYWAFPGHRLFEQMCDLIRRRQYESFARLCTRIVRIMISDLYRKMDAVTPHRDLNEKQGAYDFGDIAFRRVKGESRPYFELLVVDDLTPQEELDLRLRAFSLRQPDDEFIYDVVLVRSFEDALIATLLNHNVQSVLIRYSFPYRSKNHLEIVDEYVPMMSQELAGVETTLASERSIYLGRVLKSLRPELDLFLVTDAPVENLSGAQTRQFERVFYGVEDRRELHQSILKAIGNRYEAPFFTALRRYSHKPTGGFHALPISRSKSIVKSHWITDLGEFYGANMFLAESSATTGGLDSLLQPHGPLKRAQELAARAFGARRSFFVTNGTSTANKIVMQALVRPGDIVLLAHDCHKSHPYAVIMSGARMIYLDAYPLSDYSMYGAVTLHEIKSRLLELKRAGKLDQVRMLLLTNITFDGMTYDPERIMTEVLAIKPDMIFVWDEAWFAYAYFNPTFRRRCGMYSAQRLRERFASDEYRTTYRAWKADFDKLDPDDDATWLDRRLMPDPDKARVRVYATQSTHKTLTALRQGSMIHIHDQDFEHHAADSFVEAYMTHTSTSPNYPILASLDVGRRQVELEGYEFVQRCVELAMILRERLMTDPQIRKYFRLLGPVDMIPEQHRPSGLEYYYDPHAGWGRMEEAWSSDEITLDPTRITVDVSRTGMDGDTFKKFLMDRYDIQINKTSRNTVLFMIHIGASRGQVAHLIKVLTEISQELDDQLDHMSKIAREHHQSRVHCLSRELPPLPNFSRFHECFLTTPDSTTPEGDIRRAFFLAYDESTCEYLKLDGSISRAVESGRDVVSACFVTPYPPGFPILVPGQVISREILAYLNALDVKEIHGYKPEFGLRVFTTTTIEGLQLEAGVRRQINA